MSPTVSAFLLNYRTLGALSDRMLVAAQGRNWFELLSCGQQYLEVLGALVSPTANRNLTGEERAERHQLLMRILDNDARTRRLVYPSEARVEALMGQIARSGSLLHAYGVQTPGSIS